MSGSNSSAISTNMKTFFLLVAISLCSGAPQSGFRAIEPANIPESADSESDENLPAPNSLENPDSSEEVTDPTTNGSLSTDVWSDDDLIDPMHIKILSPQNARLEMIKHINEIEKKIDKDILEKDDLDIESSLFKLNTRFWPQAVDLSDIIYYRLDDPKEIELEHKVRLDLKRDVARIRYKAGARKCQSPDEAFYDPLERCILVEATEPELNPCSSKKDMILYDGLDNKAICDCVNDERSLVFSDIDGQCHPQNTQGPCQNGTWITIFEGKPVCQDVPADCPADGQHVYWSHEPLVAKPQCFKLGARGPCDEDDEFVGRDRAGKITCVEAPRPKPLVPLTRSCPFGSYRRQTKQC